MQTVASTMFVQQHNRLFLLLVGCGALLMVGLWSVASAAASPMNAYVKVQPASVLKAGMVTPHQRAGIRTITTFDPSTQTTVALAAAPATVALQPAVGFAMGPLLSVLAILISAAAIILNFVKRAQPATTALVPSYTWTPPREEAYPEERRSPSNRIDEIAQALKVEQAGRKNLSPKQVILELQRGNARFWSGTPERPEMNAMERRALIIAQAPTVCILSCSDSRVPVEIVFDQGLGSVFVVRVAGNILDSTSIGSIEFAVKYLGVKVLLVMGHEGCGAVKGAVSMSNADLDQQPAYLQSVLRNIKSNLNVSQLSKIRDSRAADREAIVANTSTQVKRLQENKLVAERIGDGSLLVCGAFYEITSGIVDFFSLDKNGLVVDV